MLSFLLAFLWPARYLVTGSILVKAKKLERAPESIERFPHRSLYLRPSKEDIQSEVEILYSESLIRETVEEFIDKGKLEEDSVQEIKDSLNTEIAPGSNVIRVSLVYKDPELAVKIVNKLLDNYMRFRRQLLSNPETVSFFKTQKDKYKNELKNLEAKKEKFLQRASISDLQKEIEKNINLQSKLEEKLNDAQDELHKVTYEIIHLKNRLYKINTTKSKVVEPKEYKKGILPQGDVSPKKTAETKPEMRYFYTIQVESYKSKEEAIVRAQAIKKDGYETFLTRAEIPKAGIWYRVLIGKFENKKDALEEEKKLKNKFPEAWTLRVLSFPTEKGLLDVSINETFSLFSSISLNPALDEMGKELVRLMVKKEEVLKTYKPQSNEAKSIEKQLSNLKKAWLKEIRFYIADQENQRRILQNKVDRLKKSIKDLRKRNTVLKQNEIQLNGLNREIELLEESYKNFKKRGEEANIEQKEGIERLIGVSIITRAYPPEEPYFPKKKVVIPLGLVVGLLLGISLGFVKEFFDHTFKTPEDVERYLGLPVIGSIPLKIKKQ